MNRFYKPTPREYVSSHVDVPWDFLQGVADKKQGEYDKADAGVDAAAKLLDFENIPGDTPWKREKQQYYNDMLLQVRDHLHNSGDIHGASRALTGVVRDIAQDRDIAIMKAAVEPYKEQYKIWEKMKGEDKFLQPWQEKFDPMHSTRDKQTGKFNPYNQTVGYEAPDHHKNLNESFGTLHIDDITQGGYFIDENGMKITAVTGGGQINSESIEKRAKESIVNYRATTSYKDHKEQAKAEGFTGDEVTKRADEISLAKLYHHGLDQVRTVYKNTSDASYMGDDYMKRFGMQDESYIPLEAKDLFGNVNADNFGKQMGTHLEGSYSGSMIGGGGTQRTVYTDKGYKKFDSLPMEDKQIAMKYFDGIGNDALKKRYIAGTLTAAELADANTKIGKYKMDFYGAAKQNAQARRVKDVGQLGYEYVGFDTGANGEFDASVLTSNSGFLTGSTKIYNEANSEGLQLKDIPLEAGDKAVINKEYSPSSPYYTISGGDPKYAQTRQLVIKGKDGVVKGRYAIPVTNPNTKIGKVNTAIAKNATAIYTPNSFIQSHSSDFKIKYVPYNPSNNKPLTNEEIAGMRRAGMNMTAVYNIYDASGKIVGQAASPEDATRKIEEIKQR